MKSILLFIALFVVSGCHDLNKPEAKIEKIVLALNDYHRQNECYPERLNEVSGEVDMDDFKKHFKTHRLTGPWYHTTKDRSFYALSFGEQFTDGIGSEGKYFTITPTSKKWTINAPSYPYLFAKYYGSRFQRTQDIEELKKGLSELHLYSRKRKKRLVTVEQIEEYFMVRPEQGSRVLQITAHDDRHGHEAIYYQLNFEEKTEMQYDPETGDLRPSEVLSLTSFVRKGESGVEVLLDFNEEDSTELD